MNYYNEIKEQLVNNEIIKKVKDYSKNRSDLNAYYNVGKLLSKAGKHYGEGIIKEYSKKLTEELGKGYTETNLKYFRQFYIFSNSHTVCDELTWSHYRALLSVDDKAIDYYINLCIKNNLSVRELCKRIKNQEYERLPNETKNKLIENKENQIIDFIKNPIIINNTDNLEIIKEKMLHKLILEDMKNFLSELGDGFTYVSDEYKIKIGNNYNYIDLLLYNIKYKCYVVVELKITELKKEHIGQIETYMNYINKNIKTINENKTIGIIIVRKDNEFIMEYCSDKRILTREYILN